MININEKKKRYFEFGAHFKYKDLYNKLLEIENEKKNNNKNSSCNIIMDNLKKNEKNKGISRNQINNLNNNINISCNNNNENFIYSLKNLNNIIAKNKINESCPHRSNYNNHCKNIEILHFLMDFLIAIFLLKCVLYYRIQQLLL